MSWQKKMSTCTFTPQLSGYKCICVKHTDVTFGFQFWLHKTVGLVFQQLNTLHFYHLFPPFSHTSKHRIKHWLFVCTLPFLYWSKTPARAHMHEDVLGWKQQSNCFINLRDHTCPPLFVIFTGTRWEKKHRVRGGGEMCGCFGVLTL